jgi:hypothetical protein
MLNDSWLDSVDLQVVQRESLRHEGITGVPLIQADYP